MYKRKVGHDDIERRIAERDRLLATVQRAREHAAEVLHQERPPLDEVDRLVERVARLEAALAWLLDEVWLASVSVEELAEHARQALLPEDVGEPGVPAPEEALPRARPRPGAKRRG